MPAPVPDAVRMPADGGSSPVFVDDTGRRHRFVRGFGWVLAAIVTVYLALLAVSLVGSPGLVPLSLPAIGHVLPGPAAPLFSDGARAGRSTGELVPNATTPAARTPASSATVVVSAAPRAAARPRTQTRTASLPSTAGTASARPAPTATPSPTHSSQGRATSSPSTRPSHGSSTHPTPHSTHPSRTGVISSPSPIATASP